MSSENAPVTGEEEDSSSIVIETEEVELLARVNGYYARHPIPEDNCIWLMDGDIVFEGQFLATQWRLPEGLFNRGSFWL